MILRARSLFAPLVALLVAGAPAWIATEEAQLVPSSFNSEAYSFGEAVAISGETAVVGYPQNNTGPPGGTPGGAFVFVRQGTTWSEETMLLPTDPENHSYFGAAVAISGDTVVAGAKFEDETFLDQRGAAYVFTRSGTTWTEQAKLVASDFADDDLFGFSVAVSGDTALVGAPYVDAPPVGNSGAAYVFVRTGTVWTEQAKLVASDAGNGENYFGTSVALAGDTALIGAVEQDFSGFTVSGPGQAYVFTRTGATWSEQQILTASDAAVDDCFGVSVALSGDLALIGAYADDHADGTNAGSAYVFVHGGASWSESAKLTAGDAAAGDNFGYSVGLAGNAALIGAMNENNASGTDAGAAYVFSHDGRTWEEQAKLTAANGGTNQKFGVSAAISADTALVGKPSPAPGRAYVFRISPRPSPETYCTAGTSASGCLAQLSASGAPSSTAPSGFSLLAATVEGQKDGLFFWGTSGRQANTWGNGTSFQCVVPPIQRGGVLSGGGTIGGCDGSLAQDLNALWCPICPKPQKNPGAAAVVQAQLWYRDPQSTSNQPTSLSDALEFGIGP